jgi:hypothetical protein
MAQIDVVPKHRSGLSWPILLVIAAVVIRPALVVPEQPTRHRDDWPADRTRSRGYREFLPVERRLARPVNVHQRMLTGVISYRRGS